MTKADLVSRAADALGSQMTRKECARVVDAFLDAMKDAICHHERIEIRGFGTFKVMERLPRVARNPRTGETVRVPERPVPTFKPAQELRDQVVRRRAGA